MFIPDRLRKCVAFVGIMRGEVFVPRATAFFVSIDEDAYTFRHIVTAEHVIAAAIRLGETLYVRFNLTSGGSRLVPVPPDAWRFHPRNADLATDVAVAVWNTHHEEEDVVTLPLRGEGEMAATSDIMKAEQLGLGSEIAVIGLFSNHYGRDRNIPIVRVGNVCSFGEELVHTDYCGETEAVLVEARSIGGLSGSPVFLVSPAVSVLEGRMKFATGTRVHLLGLMHGHFNVKTTQADVVADEIGSLAGLNAGIGVVIPVSKIIETLDHPEFLEARVEAKERAQLLTQSDQAS